MRPTSLLTLLLAFPPLFAQIAVQGTTATQAVISYTAPDTRACRVEVSEAPRYVPLVNDVRDDLFPRSNQDLERPSTVNAGNGRSRIVVVGARIAEGSPTRAGRRFSRALQAYTKHYVRVTCGQVVWDATFDTTNIPLGLTYNDGIPADPDKPGESAWPAIDWTDRFQRIVDPRTGLLIQRLTMADDSPYPAGFNAVAGALDLEGAWTSAGAVAANDDQSASASGRGWMFVEAGLNLFREGTRAYAGYSLNGYQLELNAWCDNCGASSPPSRTLEACLTVDGFSCAGSTLETTVESCTAGCNTDRYKLTLGSDNAPVAMGWGMDAYDMLDYHRRAGSISRRGAELSHTGGQPFNLNWKPGTRIAVNGRAYTIDRIVNDRLLILAGDPAGDEEGQYAVSAFGALLRRKAEGPGRILVQHARQQYVAGSTPDWDASGDQEMNTSCAPRQAAGPTGELGWHCNIGDFLYWIGGTTGTVNRLGHALLPLRSGADGWSGPGFCSSGSAGGPVWDPDDPDVFYCGVTAPVRFGNVLVRGRYYGSNSDVGSRTYGLRLTECNAARTNTPCFQFTNLTPGAGPNLNEQFERMHPNDWPVVRGAMVNLLQRQDRKLILFARAAASNNDSLGFMGVWDIAEGRVTAATPSWKYFPLRWTVLHGIGAMYDNDWMPVNATHFRGANSGRDVLPGFGPYYSRVTSGPISATATACPARPANSPIPAAQWPTGNQCLEIAVDGEPGDPTPFYVNDGTVTSSGAAITGAGTNWQRWYDGAQLRINGAWYRFSYVSATSGRISPEPPAALRNAPYELYLDTVNSPKTGNPLHGYLQDVEVRDLLAISNAPDFIDLFQYVEYVRVLAKNGNRWTVERAVRNFDGPRQTLAFNANAYLIVRPASCNLGPTYPCANPTAAWQTSADPLGRNASGTTVVVDSTDRGAGHTTLGATATVAAVADDCDIVDGRRYSCYNVRPGAGFLERNRSGVNHGISNNPPFDGRVGVGSPNEIDSHPGMRQSAAVAEARDLTWFLDARPFIGATEFTGSQARPGERIERNVYKFAPDQLPRLRPKELPTLAFCGPSPLRDVSGPESRISDANPYTYCHARNGGECREGSSPGELYVSCPQISMPYCQYPGVAVPGSDQRDICVMDQGSHNQGIVQLRHTEPETDGRGSRILTYGLGRYRHNDIYWNAKSTPDGKWLLFRTLWVDGKRADAFTAKLPPFEPLDDQKRNGYQPVELTVQAGPFASALVEFGYNPAFECTSRKEACLASSGEGFSYAVTEAAVPKSCAGGCTLQFPAIPSRVVYFRIRQYDANGGETGRSGTNAWAFQ